jgi:NAD-dependent SIR2 family protein deacetylase
MQFVSNGPDVPTALLQAHEEGRVVFFCGAGISYAAGLPLFRGLVEKVYLQTGTSMNRIEESAFKAYQYDVTLGLLEGRHQGGRLAVRRAMAQALKPDLRRPGALDTHKALLDLSRDRNGAIRLVTTNFDSIFEGLAKRRRQRHNVFQAPMLPVPKNSKWDGVVYLHGLLADGSNDAAWPCPCPT